MTGCLAERAGAELAAALPEVDAVVGFAARARSPRPSVGLAAAQAAGSVPAKPSVSATCSSCRARRRRRPGRTSRSPRAATVPARSARSRRSAASSARARPDSIEAEARALVEGGVAELVLVAQDLAWYGRDAGEPGSLAPLLRRLDRLAPDGLARVRLLYLYPSEVRDPLVATMLELADRRALLRPVAPARRPRVAARDEAVGERRAVPRDHRGDPCRPSPTRRSGRRSSSGSRARPSASTTRCSSSSTPRSSTGPASSRSRWRTARPRRDARRRRRRTDSCGEWLRECEDVQDADHPRPRVTRSWAPRSTCSSTRSTTTGELVGRTYREAPEIDGVVRLDGDCARPGAIVRAHVTDAVGTDLRRQGRVAVSARPNPARRMRASASTRRSRASAQAILGVGDRDAGELRHRRAAAARGARRCC